MTENRIPTGEEPEVGLLQAFHDDEEGLEVLQVVLIIALAALIFVAIRYFWREKVKQPATDAVDSAVEGLENEGIK